MLTIVKLPTGVYVFDNPKSSYYGANRTYYYNDVELPVNDSTTTFVKSNVFAISEPPEKIFYTFPSQEVIGYISTLEGSEERMSVEKYSEINNSLSPYDDGMDDTYPSLEAEFEHKKFKSLWKVEYKNVLKEENVPFEVVEYAESKNPFIKPARLMGTDYKKAVFFYEPDLTAILILVANEFKFIEASNDNCPGRQFKNANHSGLRFLKINNTYVFGDWAERAFKGAMGTYDECEAKYMEVINSLRSAFSKQDKILEDATLSKSNFKYVLSQVETIKKRLNNIDVIKKSQREYYDLTKYVDAFLTELCK